MGERLTQSGIEAVGVGTPHVRLTQLGFEGVLPGTPALQLTQVGIEVLFANQPQATGTPQTLTTVWPNAIRGPGTRSVRALAKSGSTTADNGTDFALSQTVRKMREAVVSKAPAS